MANLLSSLNIEVKANSCDCQYTGTSGLSYPWEPIEMRANAQVHKCTVVTVFKCRHAWACRLEEGLLIALRVILHLYKSDKRLKKSRGSQSTEWVWWLEFITDYKGFQIVVLNIKFLWYSSPKGRSLYPSFIYRIVSGPLLLCHCNDSFFLYLCPSLLSVVTETQR